MKTAKHSTENFPRPGRLSLYICVVVVLCFFNWVALNAQEDEPGIQLQDWMLDFENGNQAVNEEPELKVEPWMLSFSQDYMAGTDESKINFEPWMVNFEQRCLLVEEEQDFNIECWMVSTCTWECAARVLAKK